MMKELITQEEWDFMKVFLPLTIAY